MYDDFDMKYRPETVDDMVGQPDAVKIIKGFGDRVPRAILLHGPTGTGKTTTARIIKNRLGVGTFDYREYNCGEVESPTDTVREISVDMTSTPMNGKYRMTVMDEVQTFSRSKGAMEALLKVLEDPPKMSQVVYILCTTDPKRLLPAIRGRCVDIELKPLGPDDLEILIKRVAKAEKITLDQQVINRIVDRADGGARNALKDLEKIAGITGAKDQLAALGGSIGGDQDPWGLVQALLPWKDSPNWKKVCSVLKEIGKEVDPEQLRHLILANAKKMLLANGPNMMVAYRTIMVLGTTPLYDRNSGHAVLAGLCYQIIHANMK